jgi:hypothetical protein
MWCTGLREKGKGSWTVEGKLAQDEFIYFLFLYQISMLIKTDFNLTQHEYQISVLI